MNVVAMDVLLSVYYPMAVWLHIIRLCVHSAVEANDRDQAMGVGVVQVLR